MDVKTIFLNGNLDAEIYMNQAKGFCDDTHSHLFCKLMKSIYRLKQGSRQWYIKFYNFIVSYSFIKNIIDQCIYLKINGSKYNFFVLYVDDILLASNDLGLLHDIKQFILKTLIRKSLILVVKSLMSLALRFIETSLKWY
jgi:hypothetical protein